MLFLTRREGEIITIGDDVTITVTSVRGDCVRIAIKAPREVEVYREEIYRRIKREQQAINP